MCSTLDLIWREVSKQTLDKRQIATHTGLSRNPEAEFNVELTGAARLYREASSD
jgi:hypothetical protein